MLTVVKHATCPSCGHQHNFCLPAGHLVPGWEYGYFCPENATAASLRPADAGEVARHYPQGAVVLTAPNREPAAA